MRSCRRCDKPVTSIRGIPVCKICVEERREGYNKEYVRRAQTKELGRKRRRVQREHVLQHYGGVCACCKESRFEFLAFDHINGGGNKHRREMRQMTWYWLLKNGLPEGFRVLCHNCNLARGFYGRCPHENLTDTTFVGGLLSECA